MSETEKLELFLEKIQKIARENLQNKETSAIKALREALNFVESEYTGY